MGLLRRGKNDSDKQAVPLDAAAPPPPPPKGEEKKSLGLIGGIRQYIVDSYNGLYKIVLEPSMPTKQTIALLIVGVIIGMLWGYLLSPVVFYGANPNRLNQGAQNQWIKMAAVAYEGSGVQYNAETVAGVLAQVPNPGGAIAAMVADPNISPTDSQALNSIASIAQGVPGAQRIEPASLLQELGNLLLPILIVLIATPILVLIWRLLFYPNFVAPVLDNIHAARDPKYRAERAKQREALGRMKEEKKALEEMKKQTVADVELGSPVVQALSVYNKGGIYDYSKEIELATGEFLGQCGSVIAEVVDPDPVAIEVWLFDIFGSQNLRKVFVTEAGMADPSIRTRLEDDVDNPAMDIVVARPDSVLTIDSDKLRLQAKFSTLAIDASGRFENFRLQLTAWQKEKAAAPMPSVTATIPAVAPIPAYAPPPPPAARPMSDYDNLQFDPPPPPPAARPMSDYDNLQFDPPPMPASRPPVPPPPAARPMSDYDNLQFDPPPAPAATPSLGSLMGRPPVPPPPSGIFADDEDDDDPFGGTGDFTPLNTGR
jgi:hypothetical protein